jgi:hypothetical protein
VTAKSTLIARAQRMTNFDGKPRYVKWTSLGWRIEFTPNLDPATDALTTAIRPSAPTVYQALLAAGCQMDSHESDLYVAPSETAHAIIRQYAVHYNRFTSQTDGQLWYDLPFRFDPWWDARATKVET